MNKAILLDRDGVINNIFIENGLPHSPSSFEKLKILPGVKDSIIIFKKLKFFCLMVTNQPDVTRGKIEKETVIKINNFLKENLKLDDIFVCYHDDHDNCECRKPKSGLLLKAAEKWNLDLKKSFMIGDRWKDIEAGNSAGCQTIFLDYNYNEKKPSDPSFVSNSLLNAAKIIQKL